MIWSRAGGWRPEEKGPLLLRFGDDVTLELLERSPVEPRIMIVWVEWDRLPPSIYLVDFRRMSEHGYPFGEEFPSVAAITGGAEWGAFFPAEAPAAGGEADA